MSNDKNGSTGNSVSKEMHKNSKYFTFLFSSSGPPPDKPLLDQKFAVIGKLKKSKVGY